MYLGTSDFEIDTITGEISLANGNYTNTTMYEFTAIATDSGEGGVRLSSHVGVAVNVTAGSLNLNIVNKSCSMSNKQLLWDKIQSNLLHSKMNSVSYDIVVILPL